MPFTVEPDGHGFDIIAWSTWWVDNSINTTQSSWSDVGDTVDRAVVGFDKSFNLPDCGRCASGRLEIGESRFGSASSLAI